jgi:hypothetical protein
MKKVRTNEKRSSLHVCLHKFSAAKKIISNKNRCVVCGSELKYKYIANHAPKLTLSYKILKIYYENKTDRKPLAGHYTTSIFTNNSKNVRFNNSLSNDWVSLNKKASVRRADIWKGTALFKNHVRGLAFLEKQTSFYARCEKCLTESTILFSILKQDYVV